ncbi:Crp/Fnr family transcriptional regulator [Actinophytocola sp.]|uniref:Crp/Fnr family transcriptional regulator n=1 Tax=Actinophytocola sp. TaxID=1872138 RepID=UPI002ED166AA
MMVPPSSQGVWSLQAEEISCLEDVGSTLHRHPGHVFMREGEDSDFALLIKKGHVKVIAGNPARIVAFRGPNETVGEMGALRGTPRSATVVAWDEVEVLYVGSTQLKKFLHDFPSAMYALLVATDDRVIQATRMIAESDLAIERRFAKVLVRLVEDGLTTRAGETSTMRLSQKDLASLVGCSTESVKKIVRVFKDHQFIDTGREFLTIVDVDALREVADGKPTASW